MSSLAVFSLIFIHLGYVEIVWYGIRAPPTCTCWFVHKLSDIFDISKLHVLDFIFSWSDGANDTGLLFASTLPVLYTREGRTVVYSRFLESSSKSLMIEAMAKAFGVGVKFIETQVQSMAKAFGVRVKFIETQVCIIDLLANLDFKRFLELEHSLLTSHISTHFNIYFNLV